MKDKINRLIMRLLDTEPKKRPEPMTMFDMLVKMGNEPKTKTYGKQNNRRHKYKHGVAQQ